MINRLINR